MPASCALIVGKCFWKEDNVNKLPVTPLRMLAGDNMTISVRVHTGHIQRAYERLATSHATGCRGDLQEVHASNTTYGDLQLDAAKAEVVATFPKHDDGGWTSDCVLRVQIW